MADLDIHRNVVRQYRASLAMLRQAIEICPESLWLDERYPNRFWRVAYHALYWTHFYLHGSEKGFQPWTKHRPDAQFFGPRPSAPHAALALVEPYPPTVVLEYHELCLREAETRVPALDFAALSGFSWLPFNQLELQFYNIRHLQHHTAQLADRLRTTANLSVAWVRPE